MRDTLFTLLLGLLAVLLDVLLEESLHPAIHNVEEFHDKLAIITHSKIEKSKELRERVVLEMVKAGRKVLSEGKHEPEGAPLLLLPLLLADALHATEQGDAENTVRVQNTLGNENPQQHDNDDRQKHQNVVDGDLDRVLHLRHAVYALTTSPHCSPLWGTIPL